VRGHEQRRGLLGREGDVGELVPLALDAVSLLHVPRFGGRDLERDPDLPQHVLVALELSLRALAVALVVGAQRLADLLERQWAAGLQEQGDEIDQPFERVHAAASIAAV
jgi:hypothetical protein